MIVWYFVPDSVLFFGTSFLYVRLVFLSGVRGNQEGWGLIQFSAVQVARLNSVLAESAEARRGPKKVWG
jgi:hypothetical protein